MAIIGPTPPVATPKKVTRRSRVDTTDIDVEKPGAAAQPQSRSQTAPQQPVSDRRKQGDRRRQRHKPLVELRSRRDRRRGPPGGIDIEA